MFQYEAVLSTLNLHSFNILQCCAMLLETLLKAAYGWLRYVLDGSGEFCHFVIIDENAN